MLSNKVLVRNSVLTEKHKKRPIYHWKYSPNYVYKLMAFTQEARGRKDL